MKYRFMKYPNFDEEKKLWKQGFKCVTGLDEAGRGPLVGPVVAVAVCVSNFGFRISNLKLRDSKQLTENQREKLYETLTRHPSIRWGVGIVSEKLIDKINILEATKLAMKKAIDSLKSKYQNPNVKSNPKLFLIIDGNFELDLGLPQKSIIKGDQKVFSISAASIIAKVTRDRIMQKMHKKYPQYNFAKHKGYPTALHIKMLEKYGPCKIHRRSFGPVKVHASL